MRISIDLLKPHPLNQKIYGDDDPTEFNELLEKIRKSQWVSPLQVTPDYTILAGHRRYEVIKLLKWEVVEVEIINCDEDRQLEILLLSNAYRDKKTNLQKLREAEAYKRIEERRAAQRKRDAGLQNLGQSPVVDSVTTTEEKGKTRDIIGEKVGLSGKSVDRGLKVLERINNENDAEIQEFFELGIETNLAATAKAADLPSDVIKAAISQASGNTKSLNSLLVKNDHADASGRFKLPDSKFQVIYADLKGILNCDICRLPLFEIAEEDSILFLWTDPTRLGEAIELIKRWGFSYKYCWVWNKDFIAEMSDNAEILLIGSKGYPKIIKGEEFDLSSEKPNLIKKKIYSTYGGRKIQLFLDESNEGWNVWGDME